MNIRISRLNAETELWIHFRRMKNIFQVRKDFQRIVQYSTLENKGVEALPLKLIIVFWRS